MLKLNQFSMMPSLAMLALVLFGTSLLFAGLQTLDLGRSNFVYIGLFPQAASPYFSIYFK